MDRSSEKQKSSRKHRDTTDREKDRDRDREHKHRSSKDKYVDIDEDRHHQSKHRDSDVRHRREDNHRRASREYSIDREKSIEARSERERSRDRDKREKSYEREIKHEKSNDIEGSVERRHSHSHSHKRKGRGENEDLNGGGEKRVRVSEDRKVMVKFEDGVEDVKELNGGERRRRRRFEDGEAEDREERRERKRFEDRVKKEDIDVDEDGNQGVFEDKLVKEEPEDKPVDNGGGFGANGAVFEPLNVASRALPETSLAPSHPPPTKVSLISTTTENKGVNIDRSHEVPGKSSTDGTASDAGKSGGLSLDALAKAKRALQMQKELSEKLKKIPQLNKDAGSSSVGSPQVGSKEGFKASFASSGILHTPVSSGTAAVPVPAGATSSASALPPAAVTPSASDIPHLAGLTAQKYEAVKRAQELAAKLGFRQDPDFGPLINMFPGQMPPEVTVQPKPAKALFLRVDTQFREVDEHGNVINMPNLKTLSTLKVNINKQKKEAFQILKPELDVDPEENPHFDARMGINKNKILRPKRSSFQFVEEGKWSKDAEHMKFKSQLGEAQAKELKAKQALLARAKAEPDINPNLIDVSERVIVKEKPKEPIPEIEWWDVPLMKSSTYGDIADGIISEDNLKMEKITIYVEHPRSIEPPAEPAPPPPQPLKLTKKEQKKLRTQRRLAREKDRQEMIRQGLIEPPKPKVKMSNLMKVLGSEATQDPTRLEMEVRSAAAEREQAHVDRNIARKLTPAERREKKERKLFDDPNTLETIVSVYKINDLSHPQSRFKIDVNARENRLTGCAVISDGISVVVVEGGSKSIKRYGKLMLKRINWAAAVKKDEDEDEDDEKPINRCVLVWQGSVAKSSFNRFFVHDCRTEAAARKVFSDAGVAHYWDLSINFTEDQI
ncbi:unnamed protein product [Ilex paraguariensis]|uniref:Uncharacterized protein n=1 Tax=Ilex paraguariensis TaxID=185542 RepID=A0ABC8U985_9AQUA